MMLESLPQQPWRSVVSPIRALCGCGYTIPVDEQIAVVGRYSKNRVLVKCKSGGLHKVKDSNVRSKSVTIGGV